MGEIMAIASAKGIALPDDAAERTIKTASSFPFESTTSFFRDYADPSRKDERDALGSAIIRMGLELGVATPETEEVLAGFSSIERVYRFMEFAVIVALKRCGMPERRTKHDH
jgi:2-dehydropantoate 2-reductase